MPPVIKTRPPVLIQPIKSDTSPQIPNLYIGIDPGKTGGLSYISTDSKTVSISMPNTERDIWDWFRFIRDSNVSPFATIEKIGTGFPGSNKSAVAKLYGSYMALRMALIASGIAFDEVQPNTWQRALGVPVKSKTESKTQYKNRLKSRCQQLYPDMKITLDNCDALLIATYCKRLKEGQLK